MYCWFCIRFDTKTANKILPEILIYPIKIKTSLTLTLHLKIQKNFLTNRKNIQTFREKKTKQNKRRKKYTFVWKSEAITRATKRQNIWPNRVFRVVYYKTRKRKPKAEQAIFVFDSLPERCGGAQERVVGTHNRTKSQADRHQILPTPFPS